MPEAKAELVAVAAAVFSAVAAGGSAFVAYNQERATFTSIIFNRQVDSVGDSVAKMVNAALSTEPVPVNASPKAREDRMAALQAAKDKARDSIGVLSVVFPESLGFFTTNLAHAVRCLGRTEMPPDAPTPAEYTGMVNDGAAVLRRCALLDFENGRQINASMFQYCLAASCKATKVACHAEVPDCPTW